MSLSLKVVIAKFKTTFYFEHFSEKMADEDPNLELKKKIKEAFQVAC
jgi:hypothetical protein